MNETASSLVVAEKRRPQKPSGCVGILFQLFDWNRRFIAEKRKLFTKKLLPPAPAKQPPKQFRGDEKMLKSKRHSVVNENNGGFPRLKKNKHHDVDLTMEQKNDMGSPALVARLMGLDSMPAVNKDKQRKAPNSLVHDARGEIVVDGNDKGYDMENVNLEKQITKVESRPQKFQRTGQFDRQVVTRFGTEALQIRSVMSKSRKHYPSKLAPPVTGPRTSSSRNMYRTTRLINAATRILEPGLQATNRARYSTNRARYSISYPSSVNYTSREQVLPEEIVVLSPNPSRQHQNDASDNSCDKSSVMGPSTCKHCGNFLEERPFVFTVYGSDVSNTFQDPKSFQPRSPIFPSIPDKFINEGFHPQNSRHDQCQFGSQQHRPWMNESSSSANKLKAQTEHEMVVRAKVGNFHSWKASHAVNRSKDFVTLNKSLSGRTIPRVAASKADNSMLNAQRKYSNDLDDSSLQLRNPAHKRRTVNISSQLERNSLSSRPRYLKHGTVREKELGANACSNDCSSFQKGSSNHGEYDRANSNKGDNTGRNHLQHQGLLGEDNLGVVLHKKLKELISQERTYPIGGASSRKRSTTMVLQDLISALTAQRSTSPAGHAFKNEEMTGGTSVSIQCDADHLSPGSVLKTNFSTDSCFSSSLDDSSAGRLHADSMDYFHGYAQPVIMNSERRTAADLVNHISRIIQIINLGGNGLTDGKLNNAKEVIMNAELLFENATMFKSDKKRSSLISNFLLGQLETLVKAMSSSFSCILGLEKSKESNQLGRFASDCVIEWLDLKYSRYCNSGFKEWRRVFLPTNPETLIREIVEEFPTRTNLAGLIPNEIIEWEMCHSLGKWADLDIEAFQTGADLGWDMLQVLMEELVLDLYPAGRHGCF